MTRRDREAMKRAIAMMRAAGEADRVQVERFLAEDGFEAAGRHASYACQRDTLHLKPWQQPPIHAPAERPAVEDSHGNLAAWTLRRRLIEAGLSQWEPRPLEALAEIEAARRLSSVSVTSCE
jgi:hypothetical protein